MWPHKFALQEERTVCAPLIPLLAQQQKTCNWLNQWIKLQVVYFRTPFPCASVCTSTSLLCPCPPHPDKYGTWPFLNSEADLHTEYNLKHKQGEWSVFSIKPSLWVCVCVAVCERACMPLWLCKSQLCVSVCSCLCLCRGLRSHMCLFIRIGLILCVYVCVCMRVQGFNNHLCSRGALECLSTQGAKDMTWQVCLEDLVVCRAAAGSNTMCPFRPGRRQPRYRRTPVRRGRSSGGMSAFHCDYKERHNYNCINTVMGCETPCWGATYWYVTALGCLQFLLYTDSADTFDYWGQKLG